MKEHIQYEILDSLPTYGPMYVPVSETNEPFYSEGFVVRFFKSDGTDWVANFQEGWSGLSEVFGFPQRNRVLVIAGGLGYVMNPDEHIPIKNFGLGIDKILRTENNSLICADGTSILFIDNETSEIWESDRISWDGFKELKYCNGILKGKTFDPINSKIEWSEFSLNIKTKEIVGGSYREYEKRISESNADKKPWWKMW